MDGLTGSSAAGSALGSGPRGREFKSPLSDQKKACNRNDYRLFYFLQKTQKGQMSNTLSNRNRANH